MSGTGEKTRRPRGRPKGRRCENEATEQTASSHSHKDLNPSFLQFPTTLTSSVPPVLRSPLRSPVRCINKTHPTSQQIDPINQDIIEQPQQKKSRSSQQSFCFTEFAAKAQEDDSDEVISTLDPAFECVNGRYIVKKEAAPFLTAVFDKYGDITCNCVLKSPKLISAYLQNLCDVHTKLVGTTFLKVTRTELNDMLEQILVLERLNIEVGWIKNKLEYISRTKTGFLEYSRVKKEAADDEALIGSLEKELEVYGREVSDLQRKIAAAEEQLIAKRAKADESKRVFLDLKDAVISLSRTNGLVDDLPTCRMSD